MLMKGKMNNMTINNYSGVVKFIIISIYVINLYYKDRNY